MYIYMTLIKVKMGILVLVSFLFPSSCLCLYAVNNQDSTFRDTKILLVEILLCNNLMWLEISQHALVG